jgi:hypothetical protein
MSIQTTYTLKQLESIAKRGGRVLLVETGDRIGHVLSWHKTDATAYAAAQRSSYENTRRISVKEAIRELTPAAPAAPAAPAPAPAAPALFLITMEKAGLHYFLRSTICASSVIRADKFETHEAAAAALLKLKAKKFYPAQVFKQFRIVPADTFAPDYDNLEVFIAAQKAKVSQQ